MDDYDEWLYEEDIDEYEDEYEDDIDELDCDDCGPWCPYWMGDGLCELEIQEQVRTIREYEEKHVHKDVPCPVCGKKLTLYELHEDELWVGGNDPVFIELAAYGPIQADKELIHSKDNVYHIRVGDQEKLVKLLGRNP